MAERRRERPVTIALPIAVWQNGETIPSMGDQPIWPYTSAAIGRDDPLWYCLYRGSRRRVAPLRRWVTHEPSWHHRRGDYIAHNILQIMDRLGIRSPRPVLPAGLALRLFERYLPVNSRVLSFPSVVGRWAVWWGPVYTIQEPYPCPRREPHVEVWDMNCAYGAGLDTLPELIRGQNRFCHRTGYHGPWGFYTMVSQVSGERLYTPGTYLATRPDLQPRVERGYVLTPDGHGQLAPGFVSRCYDWPGIAPKLMRRLPVLFVGKTLQHSDEGGGWRGFGACYPPIWAWVTGWLRGQMEEVIRECTQRADGAVVHAYVDAIHTRVLLNDERIGRGVGQWKLIVRGEGRYLDLNTYVIEGEDAAGRPKTYFKHQAIPAASTRAARVTFEHLWKEARR